MQPCPREEFSGKILHRRRVGHFNISAVAYGPNQILARHSHEHGYLSIALRGAYLEQGATRWECRAGGTIFHLPGESHANQFYESGAHLVALEFDAGFLAELARQGIETSRPITLNSPHCMQLAARLERTLHRSDPISALCAEGLCLELLSEALQADLDEGDQRPADWLVRVHQILHDRYKEHLSLTEIAGTVHVHPVHVARAFRRRYACSIGEFVRRLRVDAACNELLETDDTIAEIAARTGFTDQSHLTRVMKRHAGVSPSQFRGSMRARYLRRTKAL